MGRLIATCHTAVKGSPVDRADQVPQDMVASDPFVHLGSAVALTKSSPTGTVEDGEIHGANRLGPRP